MTLPTCDGVHQTVRSGSMWTSCVVDSYGAAARVLDQRHAEYPANSRTRRRPQPAQAAIPCAIRTAARRSPTSW